MQKNIKIYLILFLSICLASYLWSVIHLPVITDLNYGAEYLEKSYNKNNDVFRFVVFVIVSLAPFLYFYLYFNKSKVYSIKDFINLNQNNTIQNKNPQLFLYFLVLCCFIEFLLIDFTKYISNIDIFHEGLWITSAFNFLKTGDFWKASYIDRGIFGNYYPYILWNYLEVSIGSVRFSNLLLLLINKILLIFLAKQISDNINFLKIKKIIFFILLSILFLSTVSYYDQEEFVTRSPLLILFLNIFLYALNSSKRFSFSYFILGLFSVISILWYLDIGAYLNFLVLLILLFFFLRKDFKTILSISSGVVIGWFIFYVLIDSQEFSHFIFNTINIYSTIDQIHGLIFPAPFISGDTRATKTLLLFVIGGIFTILICFNKNNFNTNNKIFFLTLFILSLVVFKTGLSRSDSPHIKTATGPLMILLYSYLLYWALDLNKFNFFETITNNKKIIFGIIIVIIFVINFKLYKIKDILTAPQKIITLIKADDKKYLTEKQSEYIFLIDYYKKISNNQNCIQILTDEVALPYLLRKKTCTKFYEIWLLTPPHLQEEFIRELKIKKPKIILTKEKTLFTPKLKLVDKYINKEYKVHSTFKEWTFMEIK